MEWRAYASATELRCTTTEAVAIAANAARVGSCGARSGVDMADLSTAQTLICLSRRTELPSISGGPFVRDRSSADVCCGNRLRSDAEARCIGTGDDRHFRFGSSRFDGSAHGSGDG